MALTAGELVNLIRAELTRCGWRPAIKVQDHKGTLYLNIGTLRGLNPNAALAALREEYTDRGRVVKRCPDKCGAREVIEVLSRFGEAPNGSSKSQAPSSKETSSSNIQ